LGQEIVPVAPWLQTLASIRITLSALLRTPFSRRTGHPKLDSIPKSAARQCTIVNQTPCSLDRQAQLADVAWPAMLLEDLRTARLEMLPLRSRKMLGEGDDIFGTIDQKGQVYHDTSQALKEVTAEESAVESLGSILLCGRHYSKLTPPFVAVAHWLDFAGFQRPE
jgi:hypothetical protein